MANYVNTFVTAGCIKSLLIIFNLTFWASGIIIFCGGIWMEMELHNYLELSSNYNNGISYLLVSTSVIILLTGTLACCCTVKSQPSLLYIYAACLAAISLLELAIAMSVYNYKVHLADDLYRGLNNSLTNYETISTSQKDGINTMQENLKCCGSESYKDWIDLKPPQLIPNSCCIKQGCNVQDETQIYMHGCYIKILKYLRRNMSVIGDIALWITIIPILGMVLSYSLAAKFAKSKYQQIP